MSHKSERPRLHLYITNQEEGLEYTPPLWLSTEHPPDPRVTHSGGPKKTCRIDGLQWRANEVLKLHKRAPRENLKWETKRELITSFILMNNNNKLHLNHRN